jgi:hypothetical protein
VCPLATLMGAGTCRCFFDVVADEDDALALTSLIVGPGLESGGSGGDERIEDCFRVCGEYDEEEDSKVEFLRRRGRGSGS